MYDFSAFLNLLIHTFNFPFTQNLHSLRMFTVEVHLKSGLTGLSSPAATMALMLNVIWRLITSK